MLNFGPKRVREAAEAQALSPSDVEQPLDAKALHGSTFQEAVEANVRFMRDIMERYDTDSDGMLSKQECMALMADLNTGKQPTEAEVLMVFASCDANHDGKIDIDELTKVLVVFMAHTTKDREGRQWGQHWFMWRLWPWAKACFF